MSRVTSSAPACVARGAYANPDPVTHSSDKIHTVKKGDTMTAIARRNNMSLNELKKANPQIGDPNRIEVGDRVRIPTMSIDPAQATGVSSVRDAYEGRSTNNRASTNASRNVSGDPAGNAPGRASGGTARATPRPSAANDVTGSADNNIGLAAQLTGVAADAAPYVSNSARVAKAAPRIGTAANIIGAAATFVDQAANGTQSTTAGRVVNGGTAAGLNAAFGAANPVLATVDAISDAVGGPSLTAHTNRGVDALTTIGEGLITGDTEGMENLNERNLSGQNGTPMQVAASYGEALTNGDTRHLENYQEQAVRGDHGRTAQKLAEAGDFWADKGVVGGLKEFGSELRDWLW